MSGHSKPLDGVGWGAFLHRHFHHKDWTRHLESTVPKEHRAEAEAYLRGIAARMRNKRNARGGR